METILKALGLAIIAVVMVTAFVFFAVYAVCLVLFVLGIFAIAYFANVRFKVTANGQHVGWYTRKGGFVRKF